MHRLLMLLPEAIPFVSVHISLAEASDMARFTSRAAGRYFPTCAQRMKSGISVSSPND